MKTQISTVVDQLRGVPDPNNPPTLAGPDLTTPPAPPTQPDPAPAPEVTPPAAQAETTEQPKVPFQTNLKLTAAQETKMIDHAFARLKTLMDESGRTTTMNPTWWLNTPPVGITTALGMQGLQPCDTWMGKRSRYEASYLNDVSWRPFTLGPDTIFSSSNLTIPISRRICTQMQARAENAFFGVDPWFSCEPAPQPSMPQDDELADEVQRFTRFKLRQSDSKERAGDAIKRAVKLGECVVKTTYVVRDQIFNVEAMALTNVDGDLVMDSKGNSISPDDQWVDDGGGTGRNVLQRDPTVEQPPAPIWQKKVLNRRQVLFEGAKSEPIYFKDFLCPLTAPDVQQADCIVHLYDKPVMEFVDLVVKRGMVNGDAASRFAAAQKMVTLVTQLATNDSQPKAAADQESRPGENFAMANANLAGNTAPISEFAEFCLWYDANDDGIAENIMLIADKKTRAPIFYDHVANVTTDGLRPFEVIRINPVENRWYGLGIMEKFESYQTTLDLQVNRWNFGQSRAGRVDFWAPGNTLEGDRDPSLKMNYGATYTLKPGMKAEDTLKSIFLTDIKFEEIKEMMEFFMQLAMNESGVMNANDGAAAGLKSTDLATGIIDIQKSGDELFKPIIANLTGPMNRLLEREVEVTLANMNPEEAYDYLEGDVQQIATLTPERVRGLKFKIQVELTTHRNQEIVQMSGQAGALVEKFYSLPPEVQMRVAVFYRKQLRALCPSVDADETIQVTAPTGIPGPAGAAGSAPKPGSGAKAAAPAQLIQKHAQPTGQSAPGGTPATK